ncbi:MAG TPA: LysM peptidoglycan-binding domain-containing protein [Ornithinibacter sp.]|nr:LysM peptidoglycan-binding domain-containing protein [Ornithinibacter sp.]
MQTSSNTIKRPPVVVRALVALATGLGLLQWLVLLAVGPAEVAAAGAPLRPDEVLASLVAGSAALVLLWGLVGLLLQAVGLVPGVVGDAARAASAALTPRVLRRAVGLVLGVGVAAGVSPGTSSAAEPGTWVVRTVTASSPLPDPAFSPLPDPGWSAPTTRTATSPPDTGRGRTAETSASPLPSPSPSRPAASRPPTADSRWTPSPPAVRPQPDVRLLTPAPAATEPGEVVVKRGDTLWSIAARHLGPLPSDAEIAAAWPAWHDTNRHVIGDDPDLLRPGQVLRAPQAVGS